jgi:hypothetical protein
MLTALVTKILSPLGDAVKETFLISDEMLDNIHRFYSHKENATIYLSWEIFDAELKNFQQATIKKKKSEALATGKTAIEDMLGTFFEYLINDEEFGERYYRIGMNEIDVKRLAHELAFRYAVKVYDELWLSPLDKAGNALYQAYL